MSLEIGQEYSFREGQPVKLVLRPEDVFLRKPENLMQHYQKLTEGIIEELSFVGAFERVGVRLNVPDQTPIVVTRPKTETGAFPLEPGREVTVGVVRFRVLPDHTRDPEYAKHAVS